MGQSAASNQWSVVVPYYNEEGYLAATLASLAAQTVSPTIVLVDNSSTDRSADIAREFKNEHADIDVKLLSEERPGKAFALATGIAAVETPFLATADADTYYPPEYIARADQLFATGGPHAVAVLAFGTPLPDAPNHKSLLKKGAIVGRLLSRQTHSGGYGQSFRTDSLNAVGGFDPEIWPYCLMDHEIMHRLTKFHGGRGRLIYSGEHWCAPSPRRTDRGKVRWTLPERLLYHVSPFSRRDWFFYEFLAKRFEARGLSQLNLRKKEWTDTTE